MPSLARAGTGGESATLPRYKKFNLIQTTLIRTDAALAEGATADNKRVSATAAHFGAASGFRPRELRPEARSAMRTQPNSAALKNASVFGAPKLRQRAGRYLPSRYNFYVYYTPWHKKAFIIPTNGAI